MSTLPPLQTNLTIPHAYLSQLVVNLNDDPPTLHDYSLDPPVFAPNGETYHNGLIYWAASGGFNDVDGAGEQRISLRTIDPMTNKSTTLLNNYFGFYFNNMDDVTVHPTSGDLFFTDPYYP